MSLGSDLAPSAPTEARQDEASPAAGADADPKTAQPVAGLADVCTAHELLGAYALVSQLASGHLTTLHRAQVAGSEGDAKLVVKRLQYSHVSEQADRELLLAAGRAGMRVRSPNFVRVLSVHEDPEPFVVMEHVPGVTLSTLLAEIEDGEVLRYALPILVDVLEGLEVLHGLRDGNGTAASLVHGAPCARHVLIGTDGVARLFDLTHAIGPGFSVTARRSLRLSPAEMAPEQVLAPMHVDARCDLFIVGSVLWRALTGQPLFEHAQREEALSQLLRKPILAPSEAGSPAGKRFDRICLRALARSRAERYGSAAELARELKAEAERACLYASRDEIANLVRTLAAANHETDGETEVLLTARTVGELSEQAQEQAPSGREERNALEPHHQGSSSFGFAGVEPARAAPATARESVARGGEPDAREAQHAGRESGTWYEGLPSIFPNREKERTTAPYWLSGIAVAAAFLGGVLVENPPWQTARVTQQRASYRSEQAVGATSRTGYASYFEETGRSTASAALPPRAKAPPPTCAPSEQPATADAPAIFGSRADPRASTPAVQAREAELVQGAQVEARGSVREQNVTVPARARAQRFLSPLPPNPY